MGLDSSSGFQGRSSHSYPALKEAMEKHAFVFEEFSLEGLRDHLKRKGLAEVKGSVSAQQTIMDGEMPESARCYIRLMADQNVRRLNSNDPIVSFQVGERGRFNIHQYGLAGDKDLREKMRRHSKGENQGSEFRSWLEKVEKKAPDTVIQKMGNAFRGLLGRK